MMTVLPMSFKVPSTSRVSLNDRFTGLMKSRASSDYHRKSSRNTVPVTDRYSHNYPTAKRSEPLYSRRDRAVERYPENERPVQRVSLYYVYYQLNFQSVCSLRTYIRKGRVFASRNSQKIGIKCLVTSYHLFSSHAQKLFWSVIISSCVIPWMSIIWFVFMNF